eukprot:80890_1
MFLCCLFFVIEIIIPIESATLKWKSTASLPEYVYGAIAEYDALLHCIWILGGSNHYMDTYWNVNPVDRAWKLDLKTHKYTTFFNRNISVFATAQSSVIVDNIIYSVATPSFIENRKYISTFDTTSQYFNDSFMILSIKGATNIPVIPCIARSTDGKFLFMTGGYLTNHEDNSFVIYDIQSHILYTKLPKLKQKRMCHACTISNGYLYVFGGVGDYMASLLNTIEKIDISNISQLINGNAKWTKLYSQLTAPSAYQRSVALNGTIYIMGGLISMDEPVITTSVVDILNINDETVSTGELLVTSIGYEAIAKVNDVIYLFGGEHKENMGNLPTNMTQISYKSHSNNNKNKGFFTMRNLIIICASTLVFLILLIGCSCCYKKRKQNDPGLEEGLVVQGRDLIQTD